MESLWVLDIRYHVCFTKTEHKKNFTDKRKQEKPEMSISQKCKKSLKNKIKNKTKAKKQKWKQTQKN